MKTGRKKEKHEDTLNRWAVLCGITYHTLERWLVKAGFDLPGKDGMVPIQQVFAAINIRETQAKIELLEKQCLAQEMKNREKDGELVSSTEIDEWTAGPARQMRQVIDALPAVLMDRFEDPAGAYLVLDEYVQGTLIPAIHGMAKSEEKPKAARKRATKNKQTKNEEPTKNA